MGSSQVTHANDLCQNQGQTYVFNMAHWSGGVDVGHRLERCEPRCIKQPLMNAVNGAEWLNCYIWLFCHIICL